MKIPYYNIAFRIARAYSVGPTWNLVFRIGRTYGRKGQATKYWVDDGLEVPGRDSRFIVTEDIAEIRRLIRDPNWLANWGVSVGDGDAKKVAAAFEKFLEVHLGDEYATTYADIQGLWLVLNTL